MNDCKAFIQDPTAIPLYSANSGRRITSPTAIQRHVEYCTGLLEESPPRDRMTCPKWDGLVEQCMTEWGFVQTEQAHLSCAAMKLF